MTAPAGVGAGVLALTLAGAVLHAVWNAVAHGVRDRLVGFALIGVAYVVVPGVAVLVLGLPPRAAWPAILLSAALHTVYQLFLLLGYSLGEFSQVYPLARGTAPWVVALVSITVLGRSVPGVELAGVLVISAGLLALVVVGGRPGRAELPALAAAVATGLAIAGYTVVDALAVARTPVLVYAAWVFLLQGPALPLLALARRGRGLLVQARPVAAAGIAGGVVSLVAYLLVLEAQTSGATAAVAALRETSIVVGALIGTVFLGERLGRGRAVAAGVVVVGIVLVSL